MNKMHDKYRKPYFMEGIKKLEDIERRRQRFHCLFETIIGIVAGAGIMILILIQL